MTPPVPEAIVGLTLDGRGFSEVGDELARHKDLFGSMEGITERIGVHLGGWAKGLAGIAGLATIGAIVNKFVQLEGLAASTASSINQITGNASGYTGIASQLARVQAATGISAHDSAASVAMLVARTGDHGLLNADSRYGVMRGLAGYAQGYGVSAAAAAASGGDLAASQGQGPLDVTKLLGTLAAQSASAGVEGQTGQMAQLAASLAAQAAGTHPYLASRPGSQTGVFAGAFANSLRSGGPQWTPDAIGGAFSGLQGGIQGAITNPSLQAFMQMAGINVKDQLAGLSGPNAESTFKKVLSQADKMYGKGTTMEQLFMQSNFGPQAADALLQYQHGGSWAQFQKDMHLTPAQLKAQGKDQASREKQYEGNPAALAARGQGLGLQAAAEAGGAGLDLLGGIGLAGATAATAIGGRAVIRHHRAAAGERNKNRIKAIAEREAELRKANPHATAEEISHGAAADVADAEHLAGSAGRLGGLGRKLIGPEAALAYGGYEAIKHHSLKAGIDKSDPTQILELLGLPSLSSGLKRYSGKKGWGNLYDDTLSHIFGGGHHKTAPPQEMLGGLLKGLVPSLNPLHGLTGHTVAAKHPTTTFREAVDKFSLTIERLTGPGGVGGHRSFAADMGAGALGAGGVQAVNQVAPGLAFASFLTGTTAGAGGGGGGTSFASLFTGGSPSAAGGGGGGGATAPSSPSTPDGGYNETSWAAALLQQLGIKKTNSAMQAIIGWEHAEGGHWHNNAKYNPLNTTQTMPGATSINSAGVKAYTSWTQGLDATVKTLHYPAYKSILAALKGGSAKGVGNAIAGSPWGTGGSVVGAIAAAPSNKGGSSVPGSSPSASGSSGSGGAGSTSTTRKKANPNTVLTGYHSTAPGQSAGWGATRAAKTPVQVHVHIDGRKVDEIRALTREAV